MSDSHTHTCVVAIHKRAPRRVLHSTASALSKSEFTLLYHQGKPNLSSLIGDSIESARKLLVDTDCTLRAISQSLCAPDLCTTSKEAVYTALLCCIIATGSSIAMYKCVQVVDEHGDSQLSTTMRVVKIGNSDKFDDVLNKAAPSEALASRVLRVLLKPDRKTPDREAADTHDIGGNVCDVLDVITMSEGVCPAVIKFLVSAAQCPWPAADHQRGAIPGIMRSATRSRSQIATSNHVLCF